MEAATKGTEPEFPQKTNETNESKIFVFSGLYVAIRLIKRVE